MTSFYREIQCSSHADAVFHAVNDIEDYPLFIPTCSAARILEQSAEGVVAQLGFSLSGKTFSFTTRNRPKPYQSTHIELVEGPFKHLNGLWLFKETPSGSLISCEIEYQFSNKVIAALFKLAFPHLLNHLMIGFIERAKTYPERAPSPPESPGTTTS